MTDAVERLSSALADRYVIERELGAGGMATVYLAQDVRHDRKVALKVLRPELSAILGGERFLAEIKTTANLQHPHILSLFDSGEADGLVFYVMPYVDGESLRDRPRHGRGFRHRAGRFALRRRHADDRDGDEPRHAALHEPRTAAGGRRPPAGAWRRCGRETAASSSSWMRCAA